MTVRSIWIAASLLNAVGLPELITTSPQEYEALAIELAINPPKLRAIKCKLDGNRFSTALFNVDRFARHVEAAFAAMYERQQARLGPEYVIVPLDV